MRATVENLPRLAAFAAEASKNMGEPLCVGYLVSRPDTEDQYAVLPDGRIAVCTVARPNPNFGKHRNNHAATWTAVDAVPENAEYIGTYPTGLVRI